MMPAGHHIPGICLSSHIIRSRPASCRCCSHHAASPLFHRLFFHFNRQLQIGLLIFIEHACVKGICGIFA